MRERTERSYRDWVVSAIVLAGHAALVVLFVRVRDHERTTDDVSHSKLILIETVYPPRGPTPHPEPRIVTTTFVHIPPPRHDASAFISPTPTPAIAPRIDWHGEAERAAHHAIHEAAPTTRGFERHAPSEPAPKRHQFEWNPEPKKVGIAGGLPYVRIGKRCAVGLGFIGCALGDLPAPNGKLFEDMDNPDRERSSVPTLDK
ncbi:MAG TPA: hypothetical protein VNA21_13960 [Steroidobacteraceae bacterium]|nr:hypothetical protein [Steroidobacteraceae bacterium]